MVTGGGNSTNEPRRFSAAPGTRLNVLRGAGRGCIYANSSVTGQGSQNVRSHRVKAYLVFTAPTSHPTGARTWRCSNTQFTVLGLNVPSVQNARDNQIDPVGPARPRSVACHRNSAWEANGLDPVGRKRGNPSSYRPYDRGSRTPAIRSWEEQSWNKLQATRSCTLHLLCTKHASATPIWKTGLRLEGILR